MRSVERIQVVIAGHWRLIVTTAELFYLGVFLLWRAAEQAPVEVPEFVYVNF